MHVATSAAPGAIRPFAFRATRNRSMIERERAIFRRKRNSGKPADIVEQDDRRADQQVRGRGHAARQPFVKNWMKR